MKKVLSIILVVIMILATIPFSITIAADKTTIADLSVRATFTFGSYPQSKVTDTVITAELTTLAGSTDNWTSYSYYIEMAQSDFMKYTDVTYGDEKYRGVYFSKYRPYDTESPSSTDNTYQDNNGYEPNTIYWFKFEPIVWRLLDPTTGYVVSQTILDSQAFNNEFYINSYEFYNSTDYDHYCNNWKHSSIRKWLNDKFLNDSFTRAEQTVIEYTTQDTPAYSTSYSKYNVDSTTDKIFLPSDSDMTNENYYFAGTPSDFDVRRRALSSDYAKIQGIRVADDYVYSGNSRYHLRNGGSYSSRGSYVNYDGYVLEGTNGDFYTNYTDCGVRIGLHFNPISEISNRTLIPHEHTYTSEVTKEATHLEEGETTYTCACGDSYTEPVAKLEEHSYTSEVTTEPTHLTEGVKTFTCACGDSYTEPVAKLEDHTYTSEVTKEATHLEEGETTYTCACGDSYTEAIAKLEGHTYEEVVTEPTCTAKGYTTYTCACGDTYISDYIGMISHNYSSSITTPATHLTEGIKTYTCSSCGNGYTEKIAKTPQHTYTTSKVTKPTCTDKGYTSHYCECGDSYNDNYTSATGHKYNGQTCVNCGKKCSCNCHKSGFMGFIWKIILFFNKLFKTNKICACGVTHY